MDQIRLADKELLILDRLALAWSTFLDLPGIDDDDLNDFRRAIHEAQRIIAFRVARRIQPEIWR